MKRSIRLTALALVLLLATMSVISCKSTPERPVVTLGEHSISLYEYEYFLSTFKGALAKAGYNVASASFWDTVYGYTDTGYMTVNDYYTASIVDNMKTYVAAMYLFDEMNLTVPNGTKAEIDEYMQSLLDDYADGSTAKLNSILANYGVNYDILKEIRLKQAKLGILRDALYGADGSKIGSEVKEQYYRDNYVRFKHIFFYTYVPVYETDEFGDEAYYTTGGRIAYDIANGNIKYDGEGIPVRDSHGDVIYLTDDGRICYDKVNGSRAAVRDSSGNTVSKEMSEEELEALETKINDVYEAYTGGKYSFDELVELFSEDEGTQLYPNGYYLTKDSPYNIDAVMDTLFDKETGKPSLEVDEVKIVKSEFGYHIIKRYALEEGAYADSSNKDFFTDMTDNLSEELFMLKLAQYRDDIVVNEELIGTLDMKSVAANKNY